jgi:F-type H+-transporting ATPase subunit epsilon
MKVEILTPEKKIFEGEVETLTVSTRTGNISVMSNHAPLVTAVDAGNIIIQTKEGKRVFENEKGVLKTRNNRTSLLLRKCKEK